VAATHQNLALAVQQGRFRADLYYRLCGLEVVIPPLRARSQDVGPLVRHFLSDSGGRLQACSIAESELVLVAKQPWPGNVRQLRHAVLRAMHLAGPLLTASDIVGPGASPGSARASELGFLSAPGLAAEATATVPVLGRRFADIERDIYAHALEQTGGNRRAAAELLDVPKSTLHDKLRRLGLVASRKSAAQPA
jgi:DNA-binding NtrC family response regulator